MGLKYRCYVGRCFHLDCNTHLDICSQSFQSCSSTELFDCHSYWSVLHTHQCLHLSLFKIIVEHAKCISGIPYQHIQFHFLRILDYSCTRNCQQCRCTCHLDGSCQYQANTHQYLINIMYIKAVSSDKQCLSYLCTQFHLQ